MSMSDHTEDSIKSFNATVIEEFRANGGKVAAFGDAPMVILNTIGAKSGEVRPTPLVALIEPDAMYVFASKAGAPTNPAWYHNLVAEPEITVEYGAESFAALVEELPEAEGQEKLAAQAALMPQFNEYIENAAPRVIPAFRINRR